MSPENVALDEVAGCLSEFCVAVNIANFGGDVKLFLCEAD